MTIRTLRKKLKEIRDRQNRTHTYSDVETDHAEAEELLLQFIGDKTVRKIWEEIDMWYA
jgi:hypothetical protein